MDSNNFRSTVLASEEDGGDRRRRDILNPVDDGSPSSAAHHHRHHRHHSHHESGNGRPHHHHHHHHHHHDDSHGSHRHHHHQRSDHHREQQPQHAPATASGSAGASEVQSASLRRSSFALRSPTQADYRQSSTAAPPNFPSPTRASASITVASSAATSAPPHSQTPISNSRSILNPISDRASPPPSARPHLSSTGPIAPSQALPALNGQAREAVNYNISRDQPQDKRIRTAMYDPTTDSMKAQRPSELDGRAGDKEETRRSAQEPSTSRPSDPYGDYNAQKTTDASHPNGSYKSSSASSLPPRSPVSQARSIVAAGSTSPTSKLSAMGSPSSKKSTTSGTVRANGTSESNNQNLHPESPVPSKAVPASSSTPSRAAELMSFSNILSSTEPAPEPNHKPSPPPEESEPVEKPSSEAKPSPPAAADEPEIEVKASKTSKSQDEDKDKDKDKDRKPAKSLRKSKSKSSLGPKEAAETTPKNSSSSRRATSQKAGSEPRVPAKRSASGQPKKRGLSAEKEKTIRDLMDQFDDEAMDLDEPEFAEEERAWKRACIESRRMAAESDRRERQDRREPFAEAISAKLNLQSELGKKRYDELYYDEALKEVRDREVYAEKERKKDMQRKRRREKSMATTREQQQISLLRAAEAETEAERLKHLRDAERANKKTLQTQMILEKGIKGPARNITPVELNLEGGVMATFQATDMEPGKSKGKGRGSTRPKKSKEQKQKEKDNAEAAQAALDKGEEPPTKEENNNRIRIKLSKKKGSADDSQADKENRDMKDSKDPEPVIEEPKDPLENKFQSKGFNQIYDQIWRDMARKDVNKTYRLANDSYQIKASNLKKTAILASKEAKRWQLRTNKGTKDLQARAKRVMRDMMSFWKRNEREERDLRKAAERQEIENAKKEEADREASRQKRKLNFLISQTELYSHFIGKKVKTHDIERSTDHPDVAPDEKDKAGGPDGLDVDEPTGPISAKVTNFKDLDFDAEDESSLRAAAMANAQNAIAEAQQAARAFNEGSDMDMDEEGEMNFQNPTGLGDAQIEQPKLLNAQLKEYQLKGLNWLVNLYEQGINGILADEMGLGKTVQSISVMAYLAEKYDVWGPFLVVAPASTLHNWQQEIKKFVPEFKVLPYWGSAGDRKVLRKFWDRKHSMYKKSAQFHVLITSYQLVVADVAFMSKMKWQYMILDEAQAIKSSQSSRWKVLLNYHCRNRLLLTGTPIQNNMQELWALLHFIMPTLFDSHDEFSEWFSKDIESHAQSNTKLNEDQLKRLHMILKPFMLRRVKKHVQKELGDKIEKDVFCDLTYRQRAYYSNLRNQISIMDLIEKATLGDENDSKTLLNLVMQFRKVCNHPDLFERAETTSPYAMSNFAETASFAREGSNVAVGYSASSTIEYRLPKLIWQEDGRLYKASRHNSTAGFRNKYLGHMMNIWTPDNISDSLHGKDTFSWLRFADASPREVCQAAQEDIFKRAVTLSQKQDRLGRMGVLYDEDNEKQWTPAHALLLIRERASQQPLAEVSSDGVLNSLFNVARTTYDDLGLSRLEQAGRNNVSAPPIEVSCNSHGTRLERENMLFNTAIRKALYGPTSVEEKALVLQQVPTQNYPVPALLPAPDVEKKRFTNIVVPSMRRFVTDSGKLAKLDELLFQLREGGHRVLLYFQMTRMIDLMEEYLTYRNYKYCRLDGSTKLEDRRDTVHDFQTRPEIFVFLLSTRAGGLGINLTSADTVIFYDSDWNPTIDSQAMDRAHRLGQTRQVTVYRLITKGTIEERIRKRALQKEEVQRVVISGGGGGSGVDFSGRRAPDNRNRDIALWLADDDQAEMIERREKELLESGELEKNTKKRGGKRKKAGDDGGGASLDQMYHEGEGNFDDASGAGGAPAEDGRNAKRKRPTGGKKAKTTKQRLAIADGQMDG